MRYTTLFSLLAFGMTSLITAAPSSSNPRAASQMHGSPAMADRARWPWSGDDDSTDNGGVLTPEQPDINMGRRHWPPGNDNNMTLPFPPGEDDEPYPPGEDDDNGNGDEDFLVDLPWLGGGEDESTGMV